MKGEGVLGAWKVAVAVAVCSTHRGHGVMKR